MTRAVPLRFDFDDPAPVPINRDWVLALERDAQSVHGLNLVAEPPARTRIPPDVRGRRLAEHANA